MKSLFALVPLSLSIALMACGPAATDTSAVVAVTPPAPAPTSNPDSPEKAAEDESLADFIGTWEETFASRQGCSDVITIRVTSTGLSLRSKDCNDGHMYVTKSAQVKKGTLRATLEVPETATTIEYELTSDRKGHLVGKADILNNGETNTYDVEWDRRREGGSREE